MFDFIHKEIYFNLFIVNMPINSSSVADGKQLLLSNLITCPLNIQLQAQQTAVSYPYSEPGLRNL